MKTIFTLFFTLLISFRSFSQSPDLVISQVYTGYYGAGTSPYSYSLAISRKLNGCQDTDNNLADFELLPANPRNASSAANLCGLPVTPGLITAPAMQSLSTTEGIASPSKSYFLSGYNLSPASGNVSVTPPANFEISTDNVNFSSSPLSIAYAGGQLPNPTRIYVRISASASVIGTLLSGNIVYSGGTAPHNNFPVNGYFTKEQPFRTH